MGSSFSFLSPGLSRSPRDRCYLYLFLCRGGCLLSLGRSDQTVFPRRSRFHFSIPRCPSSIVLLPLPFRLLPLLYLLHIRLADDDDDGDVVAVVLMVMVMVMVRVGVVVVVALALAAMDSDPAVAGLL